MNSAPNQWNRLNRRIIRCQECSRLREHCLKTATEKRRAYQNDRYWGKPVPNFGDAHGKLLLVGLAPAAHGANRTGRMFTGDRSGDWLFRALHRAGFANQPTAHSIDDGLELTDAVITAVCHCAPPGNRPTTDEIGNCGEFLQETIDLLAPQVYLALGKLAFDQVLRRLHPFCVEPKPRPQFGHGQLVELIDSRWILASYHPSQQNTFTGRLTESMLDEIMSKARQLLSPAS